jgi:glycosyltransferase involved in cell wall biosynthesis
MRQIRILVDSFADAGWPNAQMGNAREIVCRLDPRRFHVSMFVLGTPDPRIAARNNTRLIQLPQRPQTVRILSEFLWGKHQILFYMKSSPASRCYLSLRKKWRDRRITIGSIESQCDLRNETDVSPEAIRLWEQTILRCDHLVSNSTYVQRSLKVEYGLGSEVIPTGVDTGFFTPEWGRPVNQRPQVLFVGSLRHRKRPEFLLSAAVRFPDVDFTIAGEGPMGLELAAQVAQRGLKNVVLAGPLNAEQLQDQYRRADIFLFPSVFEGSPKVILEAAACGVPAIIRNNYSTETVIHGVTGFQAAAGEDLFSFLELLLARPELRRAFGQAAREHSKKYDWDCITAQWEETFTTLTSSRELRRAS